MERMGIDIMGEWERQAGGKSNLPSGYVKISFENGHKKFVRFPSFKMVVFSSSFCKHLPEGNVEFR